MLGCGKVTLTLLYIKGVFNIIVKIWCTDTIQCIKKYDILQNLLPFVQCKFACSQPNMVIHSYISHIHMYMDSITACLSHFDVATDL